MDVTTFDLHRFARQDLGHKEGKGAMAILEIWETFIHSPEKGGSPDLSEG